MIYQKVFMSVILTAFVVFSQQINISGKVTDTSGVTPIAGAEVKLEKHGYSATTGADGSFTLTGAVSIGTNSHQFKSKVLSANMRNGVLWLYVPERGAVSITTYTIQGKAVSKIQKVLNKGVHSIAQPGLGHGMYLHRIAAAGSRELLLKSSSFCQGCSALGMITATPVTANSASRYVPIEDVIFASKEGMLNYRVKVMNSDTGGIVIKMMLNAGNMRDADGNVYQSVRIGNQVWTVENLRVTKYNDGTAIPHVTESGAWEVLTTPGYCYYNNATHADTIKKWGALYNWHVVAPTNPKQIAPAGWHVPTDAEWDTLQNYLIAEGYNWDGTTTGNKIAKALAAKTDWYAYSTNGTIGSDLSKNNASGFSALPGGYRYTNGDFYGQSSTGRWWSATEYDASHAWRRYLNSLDELLLRSSYYKGCGFSVRFLRDN